MHFFFGDDSQQKAPTRDKMGPLAAVGGVIVEGSMLASLEKSLGLVCTEAGFPPGEEFKWSPGRELWMRCNLVDQRREDFYKRVITVASEHNAKAIFVANDTSCQTATGASSHEDDITTTLLERIHHRTPYDSDGYVVIVDRPSGGRGDEDEFLMACLEKLQNGTAYVKHERCAINVLSCPSKQVRCLQLADLVTSCCLAHIAGEERYSPPIFSEIRDLFELDFSRRGGSSFKIHPDFKYANLYHWLLGDPHFVRSNVGLPLPLKDRPYKHEAITY